MSPALKHFPIRLVSPPHLSWWLWALCGQVQWSFSALIFLTLSAADTLVHFLLRDAARDCKHMVVPWFASFLRRVLLLSLLCWIFLNAPTSKYQKAQDSNLGLFFICSLSSLFHQSHGSTYCLCAVDSKSIIPVPTCPTLYIWHFH